MEPQFDPAGVTNWFSENSPITNAASLYELVLKILFILSFGLYVLFAFVVMRQVRLMDQTVQTPLAPFLRVLALAHFLVAIGVLVFALMIL